MKLADKRKLVRIRQTIYEDPGNPFSDEVKADPVTTPVADKPLPPDPPYLDHPWFSKSNHRRSKSVSMSLPSPNCESGEYMPPRLYWKRQSSLPSVPQIREEDRVEVRDTRFYGFYDDVMSDYKGRDSLV